MQGQIKLVRAVASEFVGRSLRGAALATGIVALVILGGSIYLTTLSGWWWILAAIVIALIILLAILMLVAFYVVMLLRPDMSERQASGVREFVDKLEKALEVIGTPWFVAVFFIIRDLILKKRPNYIQKIATSSKSLAPDFTKLQKLFS